jgi:hypothetical protein
MKTIYLIYNICLKLFLFFLIINLIVEKECHQKEGNDLENFFSKSICKLLYFTLNYNCSIQFFSNDNFYNDILEINSDINLLMNIKIPKFENIFLLLGIIPLLKNNSTLSYKINNKGIYKLFKKILNKKIKYKVIKLDYNYLLYFNKIMKILLYYIWELIPKQFMLDNIRYFINNYYNESNLVVFEESLNLNYKSYIQNKLNEMTFEKIKNLLSKFHF